jgi:hypothetical protein
LKGVPITNQFGVDRAPKRVDFDFAKLAPGRVSRPCEHEVVESFDLGHGLVEGRAVSEVEHSCDNAIGEDLLRFLKSSRRARGDDDRRARLGQQSRGCEPMPDDPPITRMRWFNGLMDDLQIAGGVGGDRQRGRPHCLGLGQIRPYEGRG